MDSTATSPTSSSDAGYRSGRDAGSAISNAANSIGYGFASAYVFWLLSIKGSAYGSVSVPRFSIPGKPLLLVKDQ